MSDGSRMSPLELRAALSLSSIFGLRMLGMFVRKPKPPAEDEPK